MVTFVCPYSGLFQRIHCFGGALLDPVPDIAGALFNTVPCLLDHVTRRVRGLFSSFSGAVGDVLGYVWR